MKIRILISLFVLSLSGCAALNRRMVLRRTYGLRYNYYEKQWSYARADAPLKFNYYENKWEFAR